jgi:hypothetical protein
MIPNTCFCSVIDLQKVERWIFEEPDLTLSKNTKLLTNDKYIHQLTRNDLINF